MILRRKSMKTTVLFIKMFAFNMFVGYSLTCHQAEYLTGNECCPMCLPGSRVRTDCTEFRSTSCLPCVDGTYMNQPTGLKQCFPCTNCDQGSGLKTKTSCKITSDTVCEPLEGFYCVEPSENSCNAARKHRGCEPGQYISKNGTSSSDTECSDCSDGTFSDGSFTSCRPHAQCKTRNRQLVKAGTASADAQCGEEPDKTQLTSTTITTIVVVVVVVLVAITVALVILCWKKKKQHSQHQPVQNLSTMEENFRDDERHMMDRVTYSGM